MRLAASFLLVAALAVVTTVAEMPLSKKLQGSRPNIITWFFDDTGIGDSSVYNDAITDTPNLQRLANEGTVFDDFHAGASVCTPSRAALLSEPDSVLEPSKSSGCVTHNFGTASVGGLPLREMTLAEMLKGAGYKTAMLGKWHLGANAPFHPSFRGFDEYHGLPYSNDMGCTNTPDFDLPAIAPCPYDNSSATIGTDGAAAIQSASQVSAELRARWGDDDSLGEPDLAVPLYNSTTNCSGHTTCDADIIEQPVNLTTLNTRYGDWAVDFIGRAAQGSNPFFLYVPTAHMHVPLAHLAEYTNKSNGKTVFLDTILEADTTFGRVLDAVKSNPAIADNTLIVLASDNGPWNVKCQFAGSQGKFLGTYQEHLGGGGTGKFTTWEGGHHVFGITWWPGKIAAGRRTPALASTLDYMTTFAPLAGASLPSDRSWDGMDLGPVLFDNSDVAHNTLFHPDGKGDLNAMRYGDFKVFFESYPANACGGKTAEPKPHDPPLIFNVATDPAESTPVTVSSATLKAITDARTAKLNDIQSTYKSEANYSSGGIDAEACCNKQHVVCRCDN